MINYINFILSFTTLLLVVNCFQTNNFDHDSDIGLLSFMARSNDILRQDPARSLACFNYYIPKINEIAKRYEDNFKVCLNDSEYAREKADNTTLDQRNNLANAAEASCALLSQCGEGESVAGIFQCYIDGGASNVQTMYSINANASQELAALREQYYLIETQEYRCTNDTKRAYEKESTEAYAQLNSCILGQSDVPTESPPTTTIATTTSTTEEVTSEVTLPNEEPESTTEVETTNTEILPTEDYAYFGF